MADKDHIKSKGKQEAPEAPGPEQLRGETLQLAYRLYCEGGCEQGHDLEHWCEAERQVLERYR